MVGVEAVAQEKGHHHLRERYNRFFLNFSLNIVYFLANSIVSAARRMHIGSVTSLWKMAFFSVCCIGILAVFDSVFNLCSKST